MKPVVRVTGSVRTYRDLRVWKAGMDLVVICYDVTRTLPRSEVYGLASQIRRAAISVPANIAEGHGRTHLRDYLRFLSFANGSLMELETEIIACHRLGFIEARSEQLTLDLTRDVGRMLAGLTRSLRQKLRARPRRTPETGHLKPVT